MNKIVKYLLSTTSLIIAAFIGVFVFLQTTPAHACDGFPPSASFAYSTSNLTVNFADTTQDGCGDSSVLWDWSFGDGNTSSSRSPSHTYASSGTYSVCMTSTDRYGISDTSCQNVTVSETGGNGDTSVAPSAPIAPDSRVNWQYGDTRTVAYSRNTGTDSPELLVYCWDDELDRSFLGMTITQDLLTDFTPNGSNQLVMALDRDGCSAEFWMLGDGQLQLNIYANDGKIYELIDSDLDFNDAENRYYDPNE